MKDYKIEDYKSTSSYRVKYISGKNAAKTARQDHHNSLNLIFIFFIKGRGNIKIESTTYQINEGDLILLNPSEYFLLNVDNKCFHERIVLLTNMNMIKSMPSGCFQIFSTFYKRQKRTGNIITGEFVKKYGVDRLFYELLGFAREQNQSTDLLCICKIVEILYTLDKVHKVIPQMNMEYTSMNTLVDNVLHYINDNFTKDITIQHVADHFKIHRSHLLHKFKEHMGISLWNYVILRRIYKFNSLVNDKRSVDEIAYEVGFKNYSNFFRLYKKYMGITPLEFKQQSANMPDFR